MTDMSPQTKRGIWLTVALCLLFIALVVALFLNKMFSPRVLSEIELRRYGAIIFDQPRIIDSFQLLDHNKQPFLLSNFESKWTLVYFGFTHCPDICPITLAKLSQMVKSLDPEFKDQVQIAMVSVDPARDTPEKLAQYVPHFNPDFVGITGEFLEIKKLTQEVNVAFNKVVMEDGEYTVDHTGNIVLINPYGHYHGFFKPPFEQEKLKLSLQSIITKFNG